MLASTTLGITTAVALSYFGLGMIGQLLAIPPGYATLFWPASGVALGATLIWGWRALPGVLLGSFFTNLYISSSAITLLQQFILPALIASGAALQAWIGAQLCRRITGFPFNFHESQPVIRFIAIGGPLACLVNSTLSCSTLVLTGVMPLQSLPWNWLNWWLGDTIGVMVAIPWLLIAFPRLSRTRLPRRRQLFNYLACIIIACSCFSLAITRIELKRQAEEFNSYTELLAQSVQTRVAAATSMLRSLAGFVSATDELSPDQFRTFTRNILAQEDWLHGLSWNSVLTGAELTSFTERMKHLYRGEQLEFDSFEKSSEGDRIAVKPGSRHVIVSFIEPLTANREALGFDTYSNAARREALDLAERRRTAVVTTPVTLVQRQGSETGVLIYLPVFALTGNSVDERLIGYATAIVRINKLAADALQTGPLPHGRLALIDPAAPAENQLLYYSGNAGQSSFISNLAAAGSPYPLQHQVPITLGQHQWVLAQVSDSAFIYQPWGVHILIVAALFLSAVLCWFLIIITGQTSEIEMQVERRTRELKETNQLFAEAEHIARIGHWKWDIETNYVWCSEEIYRMLEIRNPVSNHNPGIFWNRLHPDDLANVSATISKALEDKGESGYRLEHRLQLDNGIEKTIYQQTRINRDRNGKALNVIGISQDITERKIAEKTQLLIEQERIYRQMFQQNTAIKIMIDPDEGKIVNANPAACRFYGYDLDTFKTLARSQIYVDSQSDMERELSRAEREGREFICLKTRLADGRIRDVEMYNGPAQINNKTYLYSVIFDVTERNNYEQQLRLTAQQLELGHKKLSEIVRATDVGTWEWLIEEDEIIINDRWAEILGHSVEELKPLTLESWTSRCHPDDKTSFKFSIASAVTGRSDFYECEYRMQHKQGHWVWVIDRGKVIEWHKQHLPRRMTGTHADISGRKQRELEMQYMATTDALTGLANRSFINKRLEETIKVAQRSQRQFALMALDLDGFKDVNDNFGHPVGDALLQTVASDLIHTVRETDVVGRYGGDEFLIILTTMEDFNGVKGLADRILEKIQQHKDICGHRVEVGVSIGISRFPADASNEADLIKFADSALYHSKSAGKNTYRFYSTPA